MQDSADLLLDSTILMSKHLKKSLSSEVKKSVHRVSRGRSSEQRRRADQIENLKPKANDDNTISRKKQIVYESVLDGDFIMIKEVEVNQKDAEILPLEILEDMITMGTYRNIRPSDLQISLWYHDFTLNMRRQLWYTLAEVDNLKEQNSHFKFRNRCNKCDIEKDEQQIKKDLHRTFSNMEKVSEQEKMIQKLKSILIAYANFDQELGYTQGMNFLVGRLLIVLSIEQDQDNDDVEVIDHSLEENIFWILVYIMQHQNWRRVYLLDTPGVFESINKFKPRVNKHLIAHLEKLGIPDLSLLFGSYYLSLLTHNTSLDLSKRIISLFLLDGQNFFNNFILQLLTLKHNHKRIIAIKDVGELLDFFRREIFEDFEELRKLRIKQNFLSQYFMNNRLISDNEYQYIHQVSDPIQEEKQQNERLSLNIPFNIPAKAVGRFLKRIFTGIN